MRFQVGDIVRLKPTVAPNTVHRLGIIDAVTGPSRVPYRVVFAVGAYAFYGEEELVPVVVTGHLSAREPNLDAADVLIPPVTGANLELITVEAQPSPAQDRRPYQPENHPYTEHPTYTGPNCCFCGRPKAEHPSDKWVK